MLGDEVPLSSVEEWAYLAPSVMFDNIDQPLFVYFAMPFANPQNPHSKLGVSVYANVAEDGGLLEQADKLYSNILWEYKSKENAIYADLTLFKRDSYVNSDGTRTAGNPYLESGENRLYRKIDFDSSQSAKPIEEYSPEIRDVSLFNGLNELMRKIEFQVGLAYGTLSNVVDTSKTATEIKMAKQRSYQTVKDIDNSLDAALRQLAYSLYAWGIIGKKQGLIKEDIKPVDVEKEVSTSFDDSIIVDRDSQLDKMFLDVTSGIIKPIYYIMEKYGVDEKKAQQMQQDQTIIKPDPFASTQE
jgi:A118 family predicted phage portal protein